MTVAVAPSVVALVLVKDSVPADLAVAMSLSMKEIIAARKVVIATDVVPVGGLGQSNIADPAVLTLDRVRATKVSVAQGVVVLKAVVLLVAAKARAVGTLDLTSVAVDQIIAAAPNIAVSAVAVVVDEDLNIAADPVVLSMLTVEIDTMTDVAMIVEWTGIDLVQGMATRITKALKVTALPWAEARLGRAWLAPAVVE